MRSDNRNNDFIYLLIYLLLMMRCKVRFYGISDWGLLKEGRKDTFGIIRWGEMS